MSDTTTDIKPITPGMIFRCSWGYDQTNVDFYEVMSVSKSGATIKVRQIQSHCTDDTGQVTHVIPWREPHPRYPDVMTKRPRVIPAMYGSPARWSFRVASYADAYEWDGSPAYETGVGWGH